MVADFVDDSFGDDVWRLLGRVCRTEKKCHSQFRWMWHHLPIVVAST